MAAGRSMDDTPVSTTKERYDNFVTKWDWGKNGQFKQARFFGNVVVDYVHTIKTITDKFYPEYCHGFDVDKGEFFTDREDRCPCCALGIKGQHRYFINAIDIEYEENKPSRPKADWSPIRFVDVSPTLFLRLKELRSINNDTAITDRDRGAIVQIKFNKDAEPANMYSASMDTKNVAISDEQKEYIVIQKYPGGRTATIKGTNGFPAQFEYIRCINTRDSMVKGLRRNGYYGNTEQSAAAAHSFDESKPMSREETVAKMDAEASVEVIDIDLSTEIAKTFSYDDVPVAKPSKTVEAPQPHEECPSQFGEFASSAVCFADCAVSTACRNASNGSVEAAPKKAEPVEGGLTTKKREVAIVDDDDDSV